MKEGCGLRPHSVFGVADEGRASERLTKLQAGGPAFLLYKKVGEAVHSGLPGRTLSVGAAGAKGFEALNRTEALGSTSFVRGVHISFQRTPTP